MQYSETELIAGNVELTAQGIIDQRTQNWPGLRLDGFQNPVQLQARADQRPAVIDHTAFVELRHGGAGESRQRVAGRV
jgi:hypothetical protein